MKNLIKTIFLILLLGCGLKAGVFASDKNTATDKFQSIGRPATAAEIKAWDIDVRPDFKGIPKGQGTVLQGQNLWDKQCASCHGTFGESNEVFTPIVGGTSKKDMQTGRVAALIDGKTPQRSTLMKVATLSTLWDYINRAMPWTSPKSLTVNEVYAVTAYILNMGEIVPDEFILSDQNMAAVQATMPNRNGMTQAHGLWKSKIDKNNKADTRNVACMKNCGAAQTGKVNSSLPDYAKNAHGNLAEQNRLVGGARGIDTSKTTDVIK